MFIRKQAFSSFLWLIIYFEIVDCLKLSKFEVPAKAMIGDTIKLKCIPRKEDKLVSIKWYKNKMEFVRMQLKPRKFKLFPTKGIQINKNETKDATVIVLDNITMESNGIYTCELTGEKLFFTLEKEAPMSVLQYVETNSSKSDPLGVDISWIIVGIIYSFNTINWDINWNIDAINA